MKIGASVLCLGILCHVLGVAVAHGQPTGSITGWGNRALVEPSALEGFVTVAAGAGHSLGLKSDGTIVAWGNNEHGQCNVPEPNVGVMAVAAGGHHIRGDCERRVPQPGPEVRRDDRGVGDNQYGQCDVPAPNAGFVAIAAGTWHSLGLRSDGTIVAWGANHEGVMGFGQCDVPAPNVDFVAVAAGFGHSLGLKSDGTIVGWGANHDGVMGYGQCDVPAPNAGFLAIAAGYAQSLGVKAPLSQSGACCESTGSCAVVPAQNCQETSAWQGAGTLCEPDPCPDLSGANGDRLMEARLRVLTSPNPSAGGVMIRSLLPRRGLTTLVLFDVSGRAVRRLYRGDLPAGETRFSWDGRDDSGREVPAGVYLAKITSPSGKCTGRVVLAR